MVVCHTGRNVKAAFALTLAIEPPLGQLGRCQAGHDDDDHSQQVLNPSGPARARERGSRRIAFAVVRLEMLDKGDIIRVSVALAICVEGTMKRQTSFVLGLLLVAATSLQMAGVASAKTGPGPANQITIKDQDTNSVHV